MKRIALLAVLALFLGSATVFAAAPCACCEEKNCNPGISHQGSVLTPLELKP
jgi:hypothetical protein